MKLEQFYEAEKLVDALSVANRHIDEAKKSLAIMLCGVCHKDLADEMQHHVVRHLEGKRFAIVNDLAALGVEV